eukprot:CAMPEP_0201910888 /NCGR_PEP_ID=MMETSP0903-20130614/2077_1 /ASSEMBLY_ACC=CAM_ASM_000552 /TAXON_ID=420261 /ORGANISM="Thalassiosira antarctica, Strain CCMP982" /LENGTH=1124 /DNA_ID=CAMNT_0048445565 /DNA_START=41 /DNA_END=3412 /DNA_ORIENTATION=-
MATLILRSSCASLTGRVNGASGRDVNVPARFGVAVDDAHRTPLDNQAAGSRGFAPWTAGAGVESMPTMIGPESFHTQYQAGVNGKDSHGHGMLSPSRHQSQRDLDFIASLPLQCDVTLVPRIPIHGDSLFGEHDFTNPASDPNEQISSSTDHQKQLRTLRISKQSFHPCGMNNIITINRLPATTGGGANYLLSLTHCEVDMGSGSASVVLPVSALPSTFQFSFHGVDNDSSSWGDDTAYYVGGGVHRMGEIHVLFDYSTAMEMHHENVRKKSYKEEAACKSTNSRHDNGNTQVFPTEPSVGSNATASSTSWNNMKPPHNIEHSEVASIMLSLEEESRFIKKTLAALGCMSSVFIVALTWTLWKMSKGKRARRRRLVVNDAWRYAVPREIGGINTITRTTAASEDKKEGSIQGMVQSQDQVIPDISPLRPSSAMMAEDENIDNEIHSCNVTENGKANHETLHLITPLTPPFQPDTQDGADEQDSNKSPRHWYEDFLSPPANLNKNEPRSNNDLAFAVNEDVSRSLTSPLKSSSNEASVQGNEVVEIQQAESNAKKMSIGEDMLSNKSPIPRELNFDTPIRSTFSPPPNSVSIIRLSNLFECSTLFDEDSEGLSHNSQYATSARAEPQAKETGPKEEESVAISDTSDEASTVRQPDEPDSCCDVTSPVDIACGEGSCSSSDQPKDSHNDPDNALEPEAIGTATLDTSLKPEESTIETEAPKILSIDLSSLSTPSDDITEDFSVGSEAPPTSECAPDALVSQEPNAIETEARKVLSDVESSFSTTSDDTEEDFLVKSEEPPASEEEVETESLDASIAQNLSTFAEALKNQINEVATSLQEASAHATIAQKGNLVANQIQTEASHHDIVEEAVETESGDSLSTISDDLEEDFEANDETPPTPERISTHTDVERESEASGQIQVDTRTYEVVVEVVESESGAETEALSTPEKASTFTDSQQEVNAVVSGQIQTDKEHHEVVKEKEVETEGDGKINSPPKITTKMERSPFGFYEELVERIAGTSTRAPSPTASTSDFSTMLAQRAFDVETGRLTSVTVAKGNDFASSLAKRAAEVETTWRASPGRASEKVDNSAKSPKRKILTPAGQSSKPTPESTNTGSSSGEFLSDYW